MTKLGRKIAVVGVSATGKSTFARLLSEKLKLPLIHVDAIMWQPVWKYVGDEKTAEELRKVSLTDEWIIEGYIVKEARPDVFSHADTVVYLDYSPFVAARRYIQRWLKHRKNPRPELTGSPEKFSFSFLKLVWTKGETKSLDAFLNDERFQKKVVYVKSPREAVALLSSL